MGTHLYSLKSNLQMLRLSTRVCVRYRAKRLRKWEKGSKTGDGLCLSSDGCVVGLYHPTKIMDVRYEDSMPLPTDETADMTNEGRLKYELMKRGEGLDQSLAIGPNQTHFGPETMNDMWKWFDKDHYLASTHLSEMFKMSGDHFQQDMKNKRFYLDSDRGRQWVPRKHCREDSEALVPEEPP